MISQKQLIASSLVIVIAVLGVATPSYAKSAKVPSALDQVETLADLGDLPPSSLEELIQEALEQNPDITASKSKWLAAKKGILASWALPDPQVGMDVMGEETQTRVGSQENRLVLSQNVPFPVKLWKKRKAAKEMAEALQQEYLAVKRDVINELKQNYYSLYWVDGSIEVINEVHSILKKFEGAASSRYANRSGEQRDVAKAQAEVSMTLQRLYELKQKRETLVARLNAILNRSPFAEQGRAVKPKLHKVKETLIELVNEAIKERQEIKAKEASVKQRKHEQTLAKLQNIPDVQVGFAYTWVENGGTMARDDGQNSWMIPLRINVPLWQNRIIPEIQAAKHHVEEAEAKLEGFSNQVVYEVKDAYFRYEASSKVALLYETAIIPQTELALSSDQAGYESGNTDFLNLLDSERMFLNAKLTHIRIYAEALKSHAALERATGRELSGGYDEVK